MIEHFKKNPEINYSAVVSGELSMERALKTGVKTVGIYTTASEQFSKYWFNCSIEESLKRIEKVIKMAD